jgi:hypothetical protein
MLDWSANCDEPEGEYDAGREGTSGGKEDTLDKCGARDRVRTEVHHRGIGKY